MRKRTKEFKNSIKNLTERTENNGKNKDIALCLILTALTCGIYGIYWLATVTNDTNYLTPNDDYKTSGGMVILLNLITCGLYGYFWAYKMGCKLDKLTNNSNSNYSILLLVLEIFGLGIVNCCIIQNEINKCITNQNQI